MFCFYFSLNTKAVVNCLSFSPFFSTITFLFNLFKSHTFVIVLLSLCRFGILKKGWRRGKERTEKGEEEREKEDSDFWVLSKKHFFTFCPENVFSFIFIIIIIFYFYIDLFVLTLFFSAVQF